jgi:uncharacterized protein involved in exopolysaccharide biosynthesis
MSTWPDEPGTRDGAIFSLIASVLRRWPIVVLTVLAITLLTIATGLVSARKYQVASSFVPQSRRSAPNMAGLAAQLGINLPQGEAGQSPQFYVELLKSGEILRAVVTTTFSLPTDNGRAPGTLVERERRKSRGASDALLVERAIERLRGQIAVALSAKTGIVTFSVTDEDPLLARDLAAALIAQIVRFNEETRQTQAAAERRFTQQRLAEASAELRVAEERRQEFASSNRGFGSASMLSLQLERLRRDVETRQQVYTTLANAYEQAKIEEVRDTPVITVLAPPRVPAAPLSRGLAVRGLIALLGGSILGVLLALAWDHIAALRKAGAPSWLELEAALPRRGRLRAPAGRAVGDGL